MHVSGLRIKWFNTQIGICLFCTWRLISFRFLDRRSVMERALPQPVPDSAVTHLPPPLPPPGRFSGRSSGEHPSPEPSARLSVSPSSSSQVVTSIHDREMGAIVFIFTSVHKPT